MRGRGGFVDTSDRPVADGRHEIETNIFAVRVLRGAGELPE
jgi:hypothetical protein